MTFARIQLATVLVALGLLGGWYAASQKYQKSDEGEEAEPGGASHLSPQTLKRIGVTVGEARLSVFVRHRNVQAAVADAPLNRRPVEALLGGVVTKVHVKPGRIVKAGDALVTVARDPIPRPISSQKTATSVAERSNPSSLLRRGTTRPAKRW